MSSGFKLALYPWNYTAKYHDGTWSEEYFEHAHSSMEEEEALGIEEREMLNAERNTDPHLPLINYTTQYGVGCFEGLKVFPQSDGTLKFFRVEENAKRMYRSMEGLLMTGFPEEMFVRAAHTMIANNYKIGFYPRYDAAWQKDGFVNGHSIYVRPFTYSEGGIGLNMCREPWVKMIATPVSSYFDAEKLSGAVTTSRIRATKNGTGWIKCVANYTIPIIAKIEAQRAGYMETIFLDACEQRYVEEGSSCNLFFLLKNGKLVTPALEDRILPGINRASIIVLARDMGIAVEERPIDIAEVCSDGKEVFATGTAAGVTNISSITHKGKTVHYCDEKIGEVTRILRDTLKGIQYGSVEDRFNWMTSVQ